MIENDSQSQRRLEGANVIVNRGWLAVGLALLLSTGAHAQEEGTDPANKRIEELERRLQELEAKVAAQDEIRNRLKPS